MRAIDEDYARENLQQRLPLNRLIDLIRNIFLLVLAYLIIREINDRIGEYYFLINIPIMLILSFFGVFFWEKVFQKFQIGIHSFQIDLSSLPIIPEIQPRAYKIDNPEYYYSGLPTEITYEGTPIKSGHLALSAGLGLKEFYEEYEETKDEVIKLREHMRLIAGGYYTQAYNLEKDYKVQDIKEVLRYYAGTSTEETKDTNGNIKTEARISPIMDQDERNQ